MDNITAYDFYKFYLKNSRILSLIWIILTICFTVCLIVCFVSAEWIGDTDKSANRGYFGLCHFCVRSPIASSYQCSGTWTNFSTLLKSSAIRTACFFVGFSCLLSLLCAILFIFSLAIKLERIIHICAWIQLLILICLFIGISVFPIGWDVSAIRAVCGKNSGQLKLGTCSMRWAYIVACILSFCQLFLTIFAFLLAGRQAKYLLEHAGEKRAQLTTCKYVHSISSLFYKMKKSRYKFANITKAILTRIIIMVHIIFLFLSFVWKKDSFGLLFLSICVGITLIFLEGIYTIFIRCGHEWKWVSPLLFVYIVFAYLPCLLGSFSHDFNQVSQINEAQTSNSSLVFVNDNIFSKKSIQNAIIEAFFVIVIITRWLIPKGKISLEELSRLLLIYVTSIADILDMMKMIKSLNYSDCGKELKDRMLRMSLVCLWFSIVQLSLGLTAKRNSNVISENLADDSKKPQIVQETTEQRTGFFSKSNFLLKKILRFYSFIMYKIRQIFEKEVWGIVVMLILKDIPISILRTYAFVVYPGKCSLWNHSVFFTLKTYLFIIIYLNRCYIVLKEDVKVSDRFIQETMVGLPVINLVSQSSPTSNLTSSKSTNSLNETNLILNSAGLTCFCNGSQKSGKKWNFLKNKVKQGAFKHLSKTQIYLQKD